MKCFRLKSTAEPTITGAYPQLDLVDYAHMNKMFDMDHETFIPTKEELPKFKLTKNTIVTNVLTCRNIKVRGLVVSEKLKKLIEQLVQEGIKTTPFQFIPLSIKKNKKIEGLFYFFQLIPDPSIINYQETTFENLVGDGSEEKIKNHQSYDPFLELKKITLKESLDIFMIPYVIKFKK